MCDVTVFQDLDAEMVLRTIKHNVITAAEDVADFQAYRGPTDPLAVKLDLAQESLRRAHVNLAAALRVLGALPRSDGA